MEWLGLQLLGNPLRDWLVALGIAAGSFLVLFLFKHILVRRFLAHAETTPTPADDFALLLLQRTRRLLVLVIVVWLGSLSLDLPGRAEALLRTAAIFAFLLQLALWSVTAIGFWVDRMRRQRMATDAASATLIGAVGFAAKVVVLAALVLVALDNLGVDVTTLVAGLGIGGIAVGLALQNILGDLLASISIVLDKPFVIGDTIQVGEFVGTVESIGIKTTHLRSLSGEQLIFPNGDLLQSRIRNHKRMGDRRVALTFGVVYETPVEKVERIPGIVRGIVEPLEQIRFDRAHFVRLGATALEFEVVWFVLSPDYALHADRQQQILLALMRRLEEEGIEIASSARTLLVERPPEAAAAQRNPAR
jgi:small-conductance mechanosensitive channel